MKEPVINDRKITSQAMNAGTKKRDYSKIARRADRGDLHVRPDKKILDDLRAYCAETGENISDVFDFAIRNYLINYRVSQDNENEEVSSPYLTSSHIIDIYLEHTPETKWKINDDKIACRYNDADSRLVEIGILQALINKTTDKRINGFSYFTDTIDFWLKTPLPYKAIDILLTDLREKHNSATKENADLNG